MVPAPERRQYLPGYDDESLSEAVRAAVEAHESTSLSADEFDLYDHVDPDTIDQLFQATGEVSVIVQFVLSNVIVSIWSDDAIDIRVTDRVDGPVRG